MHALINIATKAALNASKIIMRATDRLDTIKIEEKSHNDFVTETDKQSEEEIIRVIHDAYPDHAILGEESGGIGSSEYTWIIDPIDGTNNFIHGHPHFSISIGVKYKDRMEHGVIYDPIRQELFSATLGSGAFLNNRRIRVSERKQLAGSLISCGFSNKNNANLSAFLKILTPILTKASGTRRSGSAALDLAYVASGRIDAFWGLNLSPWDIAAGALIIQEAGGIVNDFTENDSYLTTGNLIAGNPNIYKTILNLIQEEA